MPIILRTDELEPGMTVVARVVRQGRTLLGAGHTLSNAEIETLVEHYPPFMVTVRAPQLDAAVTFEDDSADRAIGNAFIERAQSFTQSIVHDARRGRLNRVLIDRARETLEELIHELMLDTPSLLVPRERTDSDDYVADHAADVLYTSIVLGLRNAKYVIDERRKHSSAKALDTEIDQVLLPLGLAVLFMDISMLGLDDLNQKPAHDLTDADWERIHAHPRESRRLMENLLPTIALSIISTHHVNCDHSGYGTAHKPAETHVLTRLVRICDTFTAMTTDRPYRPAWSAARAIRAMGTAPIASRFDRVLLGSFCDVMRAFPAGTAVTMADGSRAVACRPGSDPLHPILVRTHAADGTPLDLTATPPVPFSAADDDPRRCIQIVHGDDLTIAEPQRNAA